MKHSLRYHDKDIELPSGEFVIGRAANCQLSLDDPLVSRNHATLTVTPESVVLADLGSRNGVRVNGDRIEGKRNLSHGDQIAIDIPGRTINLLVSDEELGHRRAVQVEKGWHPAQERPRKVSAALQAYAAMTTSAARGAVRDVTQLKRG